MLKPPVMIMQLSTSLYNSVKFCFTYFEAMLLDAHKVTSSW